MGDHHEKMELRHTCRALDLQPGRLRKNHTAGFRPRLRRSVRFCRKPVVRRSVGTGRRFRLPPGERDGFHHQQRGAQANQNHRQPEQNLRKNRLGHQVDRLQGNRAQQRRFVHPSGKNAGERQGYHHHHRGRRGDGQRKHQGVPPDRAGKVRPEAEIHLHQGRRRPDRTSSPRWWPPGTRPTFSASTR